MPWFPGWRHRRGARHRVPVEPQLGIVYRFSPTPRLWQKHARRHRQEAGACGKDEVTGRTGQAGNQLFGKTAPPEFVWHRVRTRCFGLVAALRRHGWRAVPLAWRL